METFLSSLAFMALALAQIAAVIAVHAENARSRAEPSDSPGGSGATRSKTIRPTGGDAIGRRRVNWAEAEMGSALGDPPIGAASSHGITQSNRLRLRLGIAPSRVARNVGSWPFLVIES